MNAELKKIVSRVKSAQAKLNTLLKKQDWMEDARKYAEKQGSEVKKLLSSDLGRVKTFIERERRELERFQKQIPNEVKKIRGMIKQQRKELGKVLISMGRTSSKKGSKKGSSSKAAGTRKKSTRSESASV